MKIKYLRTYTPWTYDRRATQNFYGLPTPNEITVDITFDPASRIFTLRRPGVDPVCVPVERAEHWIPMPEEAKAPVAKK